MDLTGVKEGLCPHFHQKGDKDPAPLQVNISGFVLKIFQACKLMIIAA